MKVVVTLPHHLGSHTYNDANALPVVDKGGRLAVSANEVSSVYDHGHWAYYMVEHDKEVTK